MKELRKKKIRRSMQALIPGKHTTLAGVFRLRLCTHETARDSYKPRKLFPVLAVLTLYFPNFRRAPMLDKTKMTNTKILKTKAKRDGNDYVNPEYLGAKVNSNTRAKKEDEAELRATLTK